MLAFQVAHPADEKRIGGKQEFPPLGPPAGSLRPLRLPNWGPAVPPLDALAGGALGFGHVNLFADPGGVTRRMRMLLRRGEGTHESLALSVARHFTGKNGGRAPLGRRAAGCGSWIAPCPSLRRETFSSAITGRSGRVFPPSSRPGAVLQAWLDGRAGKAPGLDPSVFRDKIVLIGATAAGAFDLRATPFSSSDPGVFLHATALSNVLEGYFLRPGGGAANAAALVLISVFAALVMSAPIKFRWRVTAIIIGGLLSRGR